MGACSNWGADSSVARLSTFAPPPPAVSCQVLLLLKAYPNPSPPQVPLLLKALAAQGVDCVAFPDDGAAKRFGGMFASLGLHVVTCGKTRDGDERIVSIQVWRSC